MFSRFNINKQPQPLSILVAVLSVAILFTACLKEKDLYTLKEGVCYMPQAYQDKNKVRALVKVDSVQETAFGFYYTSYNGAPSDITGDFVVDTALVKTYNEVNAFTGNVYQVLPKSAYTLSGTTAIVKNGGASSEPLTLAINPKNLTLGVKYMLPIKLVSVSSGTIDDNLSVTYFRIDEINVRSRDVTKGGTITGNYTNSPGAEQLPNLVDSNFSSKYLAFNYNTDLYVQLAYPSSRKIDAYSLTSANDAPDRDPKNFNLEGSNDGTTWTTIDSRSNESFPGRNVTRTFNLAAEAEYSYYRLNITSISGASLIQVSEWRLLDYY
ncbi:DUF1735 domain-containing protein [Niastella caeni]|uniref:DUF1735 domain-containing protein n=1 Tax=Niastella caeni TaxID=2569763 RepID=A0A4S8HA69_9BACT|nr:DUF1735 domain-containing protein [Niastella caeni]THU31613.1 DUF1735 domain-containing protein [Niastella caeni]